MQTKAQKISDKIDGKRMVENIIRCKWSLSVLALIRQGINRPGAMERSVEGLTTKVLNERLRKLVNFGILEKTIFPEIPPRVEYSLTDLGRSLAPVLQAMERWGSTHLSNPKH